MAELRLEERCLYKKQLTTASSSSVSEGGGNAVVKSPGVSSPAPTSPNHRYCPGITSLALFLCSTCLGSAYFAFIFSHLCSVVVFMVADYIRYGFTSDIVEHFFLVFKLAVNQLLRFLLFSIMFPSKSNCIVILNLQEDYWPY